MKRQVFSFAALALFFVSSATGARAVGEGVDAGPAFARHKTYVGWGFGDVASFELVGAYRRTGKSGKVTTIAITGRHRGLAARELSSSPDGSVYQSGYTGTVSWAADDNGFTTPTYGAIGDIRAMFAGLYSEALSQLPVSGLRKGTIDGAAYDVVRVALPTKTPIDIYEDPGTGAYRRIVIDPDGVRNTVEIDSYADLLPGKKMVSGWHWFGSSGRTVYDSARAVAFADAELHPPAPTAQWTFGSGAVPVELSPYRIYIHATINGVRGRFIFDTGASGILVSGAFAAKAQLTHVSNTMVYGITATEKSTIDRAKTIEFEDGSILANAVVTTAAISDAQTEGYDGLIGSGVLTGTIATLNLDTKQLTFDDPNKNTIAPPPDAVIGLVDLSDGTPNIPIKINGNVSTTAELDSGSPGNMLIDLSLQPRVPMLIDDSALTSYDAVEGVGNGYEIVRCGHVASIAVGPIDYQNPNACFSQSITGAVIGFNFLTNFNLTFDYPAGKIVFEKRK